MKAKRVVRMAAVWIAAGAILFAQMLAPAAAASMSRCEMSQLAKMSAGGLAPYSTALCKAACLGQDILLASAVTPDLSLDHGSPPALLPVAQSPALVAAAFQPGLLQRACSPPFSVLFCSYRK